MARPRDPEAATTRRRLTDEQRRQLRRRIVAVPSDATVDDPAVKELLAYYASLPSWIPAMDYRIRLGNIDAGLTSIRRILDVEDWGDDPR